MLLDITKGWITYRDAHAAESNPRSKAILAVMMDHIKWEVLGQPDRILESVSPDAVYRFYGLGSTTEMHGKDEIRTFYQGLADSGANELQLDIDHLAVADWGLAAHGTWHQVYPGSALLADDNLVRSDAVDDAAAKYLVSQRMAWFFPFTQDDPPLLLGEVVYFEQAPCDIRKLATGEQVFEPVDESSFH
ncbi:MAG: nuclear transport factor 2 family protein [Pseudomonadales bacterium]